ncbi:M90 family metallopeptidase [Mangrovimonas xylaniphaga]|uniref:M90 family metallopeptidase n=1 Tax=Mangrovimonas xylaniphaga TaxID=1645915 RepID=UPI0006B58923|nr:M90 family metallopeptidase [Mangrovimonas xylaniphaga]
MITTIAFLLLLAFGVYALSKLKRKPVEPFPKHWHKLLMEHVEFYEGLPPKEQQRFQKRMMEFFSEVYLEGVKVELEELDKILIAASAVIPVFGFPEWHYTNLSGVLLYPDNFNEDFEFEDKKGNRIIAGVVGTGRLEKQMILSKKALRHGFSKSSSKTNTGIHEFVHLIDKMDGVTDGVPERLIQHAYVIPWLKMIHKEMEAINDNKSDIRNYGGTNEAEFFAVASEYFFENPERMKKKHTELYKMLESCFYGSSTAVK